jgi:hypothetical protein
MKESNNQYAPYIFIEDNALYLVEQIDLNKWELYENIEPINSGEFISREGHEYEPVWLRDVPRDVINALPITVFFRFKKEVWDENTL